MARIFGRTVDELAETMSADEFHGHLLDLGLLRERETEDEGEAMTPESLGKMLGVDIG